MPSNTQCLHVRIKRKNQTFFVLVEEPSEPASVVKQKLLPLIGDESKEVKDLRLLYEDIIIVSYLLGPAPAIIRGYHHRESLRVLLGY